MAFSNTKEQEPAQFIKDVKALIISGKYTEAYEQIGNAMSLYPHNPAPHNLMGVLLEMQERHSDAMKHFRAAYALDAAYLPARLNLETYGSMFSKKLPVYEISDCPMDNFYRRYEIEYDGDGVGKVILKEDNTDGKE